MNPTFSELSTYSHMVAPFRFDDVRNVGWIDPQTDFPKGDVPDDALEFIQQLVFHERPARPLVEPSRSVPVCPLCGPLCLERNGHVLMDSEFWIPSEAGFFASPVLMLHYIQKHGYRPPDEYLSALQLLSIQAKYDADAEYRKRLKSSGWFDAYFKKQ